MSRKYVCPVHDVCTDIQLRVILHDYLERPAKLFLCVVFATQMLVYEVRCIRLFRATYSECDTVTFAAPITGACCIAGAQHWASPELAMVLPVCAEPPAMQHKRLRV